MLLGVCYCKKVKKPWFTVLLENIMKVFFVFLIYRYNRNLFYALPNVRKHILKAVVKPYRFCRS